MYYNGEKKLLKIMSNVDYVVINELTKFNEQKPK
jgi:hypothetical protein